MNGVLIYTGSPDSEGSLGGLVRLAQPDQIERDACMRTLRQARWCGSDPVCLETDPASRAIASAAPPATAACSSPRPRARSSTASWTAPCSSAPRRSRRVLRWSGYFGDVPD